MVWDCIVDEMYLMINLPKLDYNVSNEQYKLEDYINSLLKNKNGIGDENLGVASS